MSHGSVLKALTVRQPWAAHIIHSGKDVENRTWLTNYRGPLVIHAGRRVDEAAPPFDGPVPRGALIGMVDLVDVVGDHPSPWADPGRWHWVLANPHPFPHPISYRGRPGLFELDAATAREVRAQGLDMA